MLAQAQFQNVIESVYSGMAQSSNSHAKNSHRQCYRMALFGFTTKRDREPKPKLPAAASFLCIGCEITAAALQRSVRFVTRHSCDDLRIVPRSRRFLGPFDLQEVHIPQNPTIDP